MSKGDDHVHTAGDGHDHSHDGHDHAHDHGHDDHGHGSHGAPAEQAPEHDILMKALVAGAAALLVGVMGWWMTIPLPEAHTTEGTHDAHGEAQIEPAAPGADHTVPATTEHH